MSFRELSKNRWQVLKFFELLWTYLDTCWGSRLDIHIHHIIIYYVLLIDSFSHTESPSSILSVFLWRHPYIPVFISVYYVLVILFQMPFCNPFMYCTLYIHAIKMIISPFITVPWWRQCILLCLFYLFFFRSMN